MVEPNVECCYEPNTGTWQYVVADPSTLEAVVIDPVLDFDPAFSRLSTETADRLLETIHKHGFSVSRILETHAHADHLTASRYLRNRLEEKTGNAPQICIGRRIQDVQNFFGARYGVDPSELLNAFDHTFEDGERFKIGNIEAETLYLPGHTPDHIGYRIGSNVFTGDSIFNSDLGSARCDFPGGSAKSLWQSMQTLLSLPSSYRLYTGHDYPPNSREPNTSGGYERAFNTVAEQKAQNKHVKDGTEENEFVDWRSQRDSSLNEPKLIHQALQVNIRGGRLPSASSDGFRFVNIPLKIPAGLTT